MQELQLREYQEKCDLCDFLTVVRVLVPDILLLSISKKIVLLSPGIFTSARVFKVYTDQCEKQTNRKTSCVWRVHRMELCVERDQRRTTKLVWADRKSVATQLIIL